MKLDRLSSEEIGHLKNILEQTRPSTGIWYYIYWEPKWKLRVFRVDEYKNISHFEAWARYLVPELSKFYGVDGNNVDKLENSYRGFPRGRIDLNTSPELLDPSSKFMVFHGDDFPSSLNLSTEKGRILNEFSLSGLMARGLVEFKFSEHEMMDSDHVKLVLDIFGSIPY